MKQLPKGTKCHTCDTLIEVGQQYTQVFSRFHHYLCLGRPVTVIEWAEAERRVRDGQA